MAAAQKTANELFEDALIRHQIYLLRYSATLQSRINEILRRSEERMAQHIVERMGNRQGLVTPADWSRLQRLLDSIKTIRADAWKQAERELTGELTQLAEHEPQTMGAIAGRVLPVLVDFSLPAAELVAAVVARPFLGRNLRDWIAGMQSEDERRIYAVIQAGVAAAETAAQVVKRVVGTAVMGGADGVLQVTRRAVESISRTAVMYISGGSRAQWAKANSDVFDKWRFLATLDARTTPQCRAYDGKVYPIGQGPMPPLHFGCRSQMVSYFDSEILGERPNNPTTENMLVREFSEKNGFDGVKTRDDLPRGQKGKFDDWSRARKRELIGTVPASTDYQTWLKGQSAAFQDDVLGKTKGALFRDGGLTLDKFIDSNGILLTLAQLADKHAEAFKAAGIDF